MINGSLQNTFLSSYTVESNSIQYILWVEWKGYQVIFENALWVMGRNVLWVMGRADLVYSIVVSIVDN